MTADRNPETRILLTGASGLVGRSVAAALLAKGFRVRALKHEAPPPPGTESVAGDLLDADSLCRALAGQDAVVHCAALLGGGKSDLWRVNVHGSQLLAQLARQADVKSFVHISSATVYAPGPLHEAKEFAQLRPTDPYGRSKLASEEAAIDAFGDSVTTLRLPTVYDAGPCSFLDNLAHVLQSCPLPDTNVGNTPYEMVHADDVATAVLCALRAPPAHRTCNICGPDRAPFGELIGLASDVLGIQPTWRRAANRGEAPGPGIAGPEEFPDFLYQAATTPRTLNMDAARLQLGYVPRIGWREGLRRALGRLANRAS